jgi:hypothetical protein
MARVSRSGEVATVMWSVLEVHRIVLTALSVHTRNTSLVLGSPPDQEEDRPPP